MWLLTKICECMAVVTNVNHFIVFLLLATMSICAPIYCNLLCVVYLLCEACEASRSRICVFICAVTECSSKCLYNFCSSGPLKMGWGVASLKFLVFFFTAKFEIWWIFRTPLENKTTAQCKIVDPTWEDLVHVWGGVFCEGVGGGVWCFQLGNLSSLHLSFFTTSSLHLSDCYPLRPL